MFEEMRKEFNIFRFLTILLIIAVSIYLFQILWQIIGNFSDVIVIGIIAWLLSFIFEPIVEFLKQITRLPKVWAALLVYIFFGILFSLMVFIFLPVVINESQSLSTIVPRYLAPYPGFIRTWNNTVTNSVDYVISFIPSLANVFLDTILVLILSFYLIIDKEKINKEIYRLSPKSWHGNLKFIQGVIDETFSSFLRIQVIFGVLSGITTWLVLTVFAIKYAASVSLVAGILTIIPLIGPILGIIPPVFIVFITNPLNPLEAVLVLAILLLLQQITFNIVGPKLMSRAFKLHPIIVLLSILIGFKIAGALGAVFIVPVLGILVVVLKELGHYFINPPSKEPEHKK